MTRPRLLDLFLARSVRPVSGCWDWTAAKNNLGYGQLWFADRMVYAHRFAYEHFVEPIGVGLEIDHLCGNPSCCNPAHLEAVTHAENMRRIQDRQMSCRKAGHDWTDPRNVYIRKNGRRYCAECRRIKSREVWRAASQVA